MLGRKLKIHENSSDHVVDFLARQRSADFQYNAQGDENVIVRPKQIVGHLLSKADELLGGFRERHTSERLPG
jgi:hypothetical protein